MAKKQNEKVIFSKSIYWYIVLVFILIRLVLNLIPPLTILFISFAIIYLLFFVWQIKNYKYFLISLLIFLVIDSMIGTYFFLIENISNIEFYGTLVLNLIIILLLFFNPKNSFRN
ncbi:MAG: hypothetical protein QW727_03060 [Candidatus Pacearchaeota archaeon]